MLRILNDKLSEDVIRGSAGVDVPSLLKELSNNLSTVEYDEVCRARLQTDYVAIRLSPFGELDVKLI